MAQRGHTNVDSFKDEAPVQVQNNFLGGLKTEFTGMNFPPNACTETNNVVFSLIGDVTRRKGINYENSFVYNAIDRTNCVVNTYHWLNAGGDGETQVLVVQIGKILYFYETSSATVFLPVSTRQLASAVDISSFLVASSTADPSISEAQFADGNGYLFVYHPDCEPFYCKFNDGTIIANQIDLKVRDFVGYPEPGVAVTARLGTLSNEHLYNLQNQGWSKGPQWTTSSRFSLGGVWSEDTASPVVDANPVSADAPSLTLNVVDGQQIVTVPTGNQTFKVDAGLPLKVGDSVAITVSDSWWLAFAEGSMVEVTYRIQGVQAEGNVTSYSGTTLVVDVSKNTPFGLPVGLPGTPGGGLGGLLHGSVVGIGYQLQQNFEAMYTVASGAAGDLIDTWFNEIGNYPSNADVWWNYKTVETSVTNVSGGSVSTANAVFDPATTVNEVGLPSTPAPKGHYIVNAFNQNQSNISTVTGLTNISTTARPTTGTWFNGRVWYTGVNASQQATGDQDYYTWTEDIYFSQIVDDATQFGLCHQVNDPTDENLFAILSSDGGVITIQGSGAVYKLFPIQNGMLVFAANGIWFITGSAGIGFTATDYTVTKISNVRSISNNSYVNVNGYPLFWNEEGIYMVTATNNGIGVQVEPMTVKTIRSFYGTIPRDSKKYARGVYDPINYIVQWIYRSTEENNVTSRYSFDSILCFNTATQAFYTYNIGGTPTINAIDYISNPGGTDAPDPIIKYMASSLDGASYRFTFAEEKDEGYVDWFSYDNTGVTYDSHFITGYGLSGQGLRLFQPGYINVYSRNIDSACGNGYIIQGLWNYANTRNSGKWSNKQVAYTSLADFSMFHRRHKIRGHGTVIQFKFSSYQNCPFDIMGWAVWETQNVGV